MINKIFKLKLRLSISIFLLNISINVFSQNNEAKSEKPNVILILADDLGYKDVGFNGCADFKTPNIDKLAEGGAICTNAYASHSFCAPTRAGIMTGRYQHRFGFQENPSQRFHNLGLPESEEILPKVLKQAGYTSALVGKWHLGVMKNQHPVHKGFDKFYGFTGGGHHYYQCDPKVNNDHSYTALIEENGKRKSFDNYLTDDLTDYALDFIERNAEQPFFLYLSYNAPHTPLQAPQEYLDRVSNIADKKRRIYAAMITALDDGVGAIMSLLEMLKIEENTLVFFMSDNGGTPGTWSDNKPFSGMKGTVLEGGIHVPYVVYWKGKIQPQIYKHLVMSFDVFSTATELAGISHKTDKKIDSKNLLPYLLNEKKSKPHDFLYWTQGHFQEALRWDDYKFIKIDGQEKFLFNLKNDVGETTNISKKKKGKLKKMNNAFDSWKSEMPETKHLSTGIAIKLQQEVIDNLRSKK
ncbi:sulfatase-like hydrolase/transferase [Sabulilitoribacter arenilitoris]|uniref:Sulfatase-like hydrolase/transferase n=1 Tax=Wocania arenilitoris TaxID=2044858 RepID=A0AAE3ELP7_9FLAO|nr:sulfatase-like hydrolase/transferase [Wocania arenilitoris]MCF7567266.1 sulfatase-like hydrolase/transferase [Wocania arenilitoris]